MVDSVEECCKHSKFEKILLIIVVILTAIAIGLGIALMMKSKSATCNSKECIEQAAKFLKNKDPSAEPCTDFYQYACGSYANRTDLSEFDNDGFLGLDDKFKFSLQRLIEQPWKRHQPSYYKKIKDFYSSCMDVDKIEEFGASPLHAKLDEAGGWPVLLGSSWNENNFDLMETLIKFRRWGIEIQQFFTLTVIGNLLNSSSYIINLDEPKMILQTSDYKEEKYREIYLKYMVKTATLLGATRFKTVETDFKEVLELEAAIAVLSVPPLARRDIKKFHNKMSLRELQRLTKFDWVDFLNALNFPRRISSNERVVVAVPETLKEVFSLISQTNNRTISNYMLWRLILQTIGYLDESFQKLNSKFKYDLKRVSGDSLSRKDYCFSQTLQSFGQGAAAMFVKNVFDPATKDSVRLLVNTIKEELKISISNADWLDVATKKKAIAKLTATKEFVAYPDQLLDDSIVNSLFKSLTISENNFFNNQMEIYKHKFEANLASLNKTVDELSWIAFANSLQTTVVYSNFYNRIEIYAGILSDNFFNPNLQKYLNYAGIGTVISRELIHGFDDKGKNFDVLGNLQNWWSKETEKKFRAKTDMIFQQYSSIASSKINFNVTNIVEQEEIISDIEGLNLAYKAYVNSVKRKKPELGLPGLSLNSKQLFWLKSANILCSILPNEPEIVQTHINPRFPSRLRVLGAFMNSKYFSKDYNCPEGSPMNPVEKISFYE